MREYLFEPAVSAAIRKSALIRSRPRFSVAPISL